MLDEIDAALLAELRKDGRQTSAQLGEAVGLSPSAAHRRVRALEERGLIQGYRAVLSHEALGAPSTFFVSVTLQSQRNETLDRFEQAALRCEHVKACFLMTGQMDYLLKVQVPAGESYESVHRNVLSRLPGVERLVSHVTIRTVRDEG